MATIACFIIGLTILVAEIGGFIYAFYQIIKTEGYPLLFLLFLFGGMILIITIVCIKAFFDSRFKTKGKKINIIVKKETNEG